MEESRRKAQGHEGGDPRGCTQSRRDRAEEEDDAPGPAGKTGRLRVIEDKLFGRGHVAVTTKAMEEAGPCSTLST